MGGEEGWEEKKGGRLQSRLPYQHVLLGEEGWEEKEEKEEGRRRRRRKQVCDK